MKLVLVGINSKYIHTNLAIRKIKAYLDSKGLKAEIKEYSGAEEKLRVAADILSENPDIIGFSCYIWNIGYVLALADIIKKADENIKIFLGGPEAQYNADKLLKHYSFIDSICVGEGEKICEKMLTEGFENGIISGPETDMDEMPFPYSDEDLSEKGRIFYYESSRGCPFSCVYCLSSEKTKVKYRSLDKVFADLDIFAKHNVKLVKFVDRTFNSDLLRSKEILKYIKTLDCDTEFHVEIAADITDDEFIEILRTFPENKIRLEAGLQSANSDVLKICGRKCNLEKFTENIQKILSQTKATLHLDLIAGLPSEDAASFKNSFDFAYSLRPHELQLGFLKVLPGTPVQKMAEKYEIKYTKEAPYEVVSTADMPFSVLANLKNIELVLEYYSNSKIAENSLRFLLDKFPSPYGLFESLAQYFVENKLNKTPHHRVKLFAFLYDFAKEKGLSDEDFEIALCKDFLVSCAGAKLPSWVKAFDKDIKKEEIWDVVGIDENIKDLTELIKIPVKHRHKHIKIEKLYGMVWLVSYADKKILDITAFWQ